jgi:hypothetical protein
VVLEVAGEAGLDVAALADALHNGRHRREVFDDHAVAQSLPPRRPGSTPAFGHAAAIRWVRSGRDSGRRG